MKKKTLGIIGLIGAPFLFIDMLVGARFPDFAESAPWLSGFCGLLYITGWLASMENLRQTTETNKRDFSWYAIRIVMFTLIIADISNIWAITTPAKPALYYILDAGWPVSHLLMLPVAWAVIKGNLLKGYRQYLPLLMGLWFPVCMLLGRNDFALYFGGIYSTLIWSLFAVAVMRAQSNPIISQYSFNHKHTF
ncbi:hypothetical protein [Emticicia sp. C21]|uniref:hypothetical protein n=1 Tax=Emticicia sp. C21 TaxID=2302915 RepID=UPI0011C1655D|nr:hypothetical protein [Emticicia sp. C21]